MPKTRSANVARNVKAALKRLVHDLGTQAAIAKSSGISEATLSKWVAGTVRPSAKGLRGLSQMLGLDVEHFAQSAEAFDHLLALRVSLSSDREVAIRLKPVQRHRSSWSTAWQAVQGSFKFLYAHRDGTIEVSDIEFGTLSPNGIHTLMKNSNTEEGRVWLYRGQSFSVDGFLYSILGEESSEDEVFFLIFNIPVGRDTGVVFGNFLARSVKEAMKSTKAQPCVLLPVSMLPAIADVHGTYTAEELHRLGLLNRSTSRHLADAPTLALREKLSTLFG